MMENAAIRDNAVGRIYADGVRQRKDKVLSSLPPELAALHIAGDLHIHDLEFFGQLYNCCTPDLDEYLRSCMSRARTDAGKMADTLESVKQLIQCLAVVQSGGIGFGNFDADVNRAFHRMGIRETSENKTLLSDIIASFIRWVNESRTRYSRETYYITLNLGLETGFWGRAVTEALLTEFASSPMLYTKPNIVFKVSEAINAGAGTPNYDLFTAAAACTSRRMIPTYLLMDSETNSECDPLSLNIMGCRTRVYDNSCGQCGTIGRGNVAYFSINLPRIALERGSSPEFFEQLDYLMDACCQMVEIRNEQLRATGGELVNYIFDENLWNDVESVDDLLRQGTYSIGFIGLSEAVEILLGSKMYDSDEALELAHSIVRHMRDFVDKQRSETHRNYSLLATPGEMISGRFCSLDNERCKHSVQDKGFYTNSFHVDVDSRISIADKLAFEGPFHKMCNGGSITYVEFESALIGNELAVEDAVRYATKCGVSYMGFNYPLDVCRNCGAHGTFDVCECGSNDITRIRRVSGYLEDTSFFTSGKRAEVQVRMPNVRLRASEA